MQTNELKENLLINSRKKAVAEYSVNTSHCLKFKETMIRKSKQPL